MNFFSFEMFLSRGMYRYSAIKGSMNRLINIRKFLPFFHEYSNGKSHQFSSLVNEFIAVLPKTKILSINVPCNLKLKSLDPQSQADDCMIARAYGPPETEFIMQLVEGKNNLIFAARPTQTQEMKKMYLEIEIPVQCDIDVVSKLGDVSVESFVSDQLSVEAENGDINCKKLKCGKMNLKSSAGDINCEGTLLGNIKIKAGKHGTIRGANFQGNALEIETEYGDIAVSSTYSDNSSFMTKKGNISLKNLHRKSRISIQKGNLSICGLDGSLDAKVQHGDIKVQITQLNADSSIETRNGKVSLSVTNGNVCQFDLSGREIQVSEESLRSMGEMERSSNGKVFRSMPSTHLTSAVMKVVSENGEVFLKEESWISSLKLSER